MHNLELCDNSPKDKVLCYSVARKNNCGFLTVKVVPIHACSQGKLVTSKDGTTFTEEMPTIIFSMQHCVKERFIFLVYYISQNK